MLFVLSARDKAADGVAANEPDAAALNPRTPDHLAVAVQNGDALRGRRNGLVALFLQLRRRCTLLVLAFDGGKPFRRPGGGSRLLFDAGGHQTPSQERGCAVYTILLPTASKSAAEKPAWFKGGLHAEPG